MKINHLLLFGLLTSMTLTSCGGTETSEDAAGETAETQEEAAEPEEEIEVDDEPSVNLNDFIKGTWAKIAQGCDENGENCEESKGSEWNFDGQNVQLGRIKQPYTISNDTIYIAESPYRIAMSWGDTILLNGIAKNRFMKLVKSN